MKIVKKILLIVLVLIYSSLNTALNPRGIVDWEKETTNNNIEFKNYTILGEGQTDDAVSEISKIQNNTTNYTGAIVTFVDDDADPSFKDIWEPILINKGIKITLAVITGRVGKPNSLSLEELTDLQSKGNDIVSHTVNHYSTRNSSLSVLETEYKDSQQWLVNNGFYKGKDILVYPGGIGDATSTSNIPIKNIARKYYKYAVATDGYYNELPVDNWAIQRPNADILSAKKLKDQVDGAIRDNGWLVILTHSLELQKDKNNNIAKINEVIDYCKTLNIPILPFTEAEKVKGNALAIGEYSNNNGTFISMNGNSKISSGLIVRNTQNGDMDAPISTYKKNTKTVQILDRGADKFLATGGVYEVFRGNSDLYSYSTFSTYKSNKIYYRKWNHYTSKWDPFEDTAKQAYDTGTWTPKLEGSLVLGNHKYEVQFGSWTKSANMVTARFCIKIPTTGFDKTMSGDIKITGLPFSTITTEALPISAVEYNILNLDTDYNNVFMKVLSNSNFISLFKSGNGVRTTRLDKSSISLDDTITFSGQITYQIQ
jgi:peptidoglycan/xylan/chitin deacetylase (PgdA/CDA1 family)